MKGQADQATQNEVFQIQERVKLVFESKRQENQEEKKDGQAIDGEAVSAGLQRELKGLESLKYYGTENRQKRGARGYQ